MSDIIYSSRFTPSGEKNVYEKFFAIPVSLIKVLLTISEKPELNHFERAVLSLLINKYYTIGQLSEILILKKDLVELIITDLKKKGLIVRIMVLIMILTVIGIDGFLFFF